MRYNSSQLFKSFILSFLCVSSVLTISSLFVTELYGDPVKNHWVSIGPSGGDRFEIYIDPQNNQKIYAVGGNIHKSTDGGENWAHLQNPTAYTSGLAAYSLAFDPINTDVLYLGTTDGVWKSTNGGGSWDPINQGIPETDQIIRKVLVDQTNPDITYVSTSDVLMNLLSSYERSLNLASAVYRSTNGGATWQPFSAGLPQPYTSVTDIYQNPLTGELYATTLGDGVFHYNLETSQWQTLNNGLASPLGMYITRLIMHPEDPEVFFLLTHKDWVYKTTNGGALWEPLPFPGELNAPYPPMAYTAAIDPNNPSVMWLSAFPGGSYNKEVPFFQAHEDQDVGGFWVSTDGSETWTKVNWPQVLPGGGPKGITIDRTEVIEGPPVRRSRTMYAASGGIFCVLKSSDGGVSFNTKTKGLNADCVDSLLQHPTESEKLFATTEAVIHYSFDSGNTWSSLIPVIASSGLIYIWDIAIAPDNPDILYYGAGNPAWVSPEEKGLYKLDIRTLDPSEGIHTGGPGEFIQSTAGIGIWKVYPGSAGTIFLATQNNGILKTEDGGASWYSMNNGLGQLSVTSILFDEQGEPIYAAAQSSDGSPLSESSDGDGDSQTGALYKWDDQSGAWLRIAQTDITTPVYDLDRSQGNPDRIYAATLSGLFITNDGGIHWEKNSFGSQMGDGHINMQIAVSPFNPDLVAIASWAYGVFVSYDAGASWIPYYQDLLPSPTMRIVWDRVNSHVIYAATLQGSIFRCTMGDRVVVDSVLSDGNPLSSPYSVSKREVVDTFLIQINASDPDGDPIIYSAYLNGDLVPDPSNNPQGKKYTFDPTTHTFQWTPYYTASQNSPFDLKFVVTDNILPPVITTVQLVVEPMPVVYAPKVSLSLNKSDYIVGDQMILRMGVKNEYSPVTIDLYLSLRYSTSTGREVFYPIVRNVTLPYMFNISDIVLISTRVPRLYPGTYIWRLVILQSGKDVGNAQNWLHYAEAAFGFR